MAALPLTRTANTRAVEAAAKRRFRLARALVASLAASLALGAGPAFGAGVVSVTTFTPTAKQVVYTGDAGTNVVGITGSGTSVAITEAGITETAAECVQSGDTVSCNDPAFESVRAELDAGGDTLTNDHASIRTIVRGGPGDDSLTGADSPTLVEFLDGGSENDTIDARGGDDNGGFLAPFPALSGGQGDDTIRGGAGNDRIDGGPGSDPLLAGGEGNDSISGDAFGGGAENDKLTGGPGSDFLGAGDGRDELDGEEGDDSLFGGSGNGDDVDGGPGNDRIFAFGGDGQGDVQKGGPGFDELSYSDLRFPPGPNPDNFLINLATGEAGRTNNGPETDSVSEVEDASGDRGADVLVGTDGSNVLMGFGGNDFLDGGRGSDLLTGDGFGSAGDDTIQARDGLPDRVLCGPGTDTALLDQLDEHGDCENADVAFVQPFASPSGQAAIPSGQADLLGPTCRTFGLDTSQSVRQFFRGFRFRVSCNEAYRLEATLFVRVRRIRRGQAITGRAGDLVLGERRLRLGSGQRRVRLRPSRAFRRALGRRFRARLKLDAFDGSGNRRTTFRTIRVRR